MEGRVSFFFMVAFTIPDEEKRERNRKAGKREDRIGKGDREREV